MPRLKEQKVDQVRIYNGESLSPKSCAGGICAVTGLAHVRPGDARARSPQACARHRSVSPIQCCRANRVHAVFKALSELADEDPMLGVSWNTHLEQIPFAVDGRRATRVVQRVLADRDSLSVAFEPGGILYNAETISRLVEGVGH